MTNSTIFNFKMWNFT